MVKSSNNRLLCNKYIGPYMVIDRKGLHAYKLALPPRMRLYHTVHASLLKPYYTCDHYTDLDNETNEEPLYTIDKIINSRRFHPVLSTLFVGKAIPTTMIPGSPWRTYQPIVSNNSLSSCTTLPATRGRPFILIWRLSFKEDFFVSIKTLS